jgi:hypothetical protein
MCQRDTRQKTLSAEFNVFSVGVLKENGQLHFICLNLFTLEMLSFALLVSILKIFV